jgi:hypothetical protein
MSLTSSYRRDTIQSLRYFLEHTIQTMSSNPSYTVVYPVVVECIPASYKFDILAKQPNLKDIVAKMAMDIYYDKGMQKIMKKIVKLLEERLIMNEEEEDEEIRDRVRECGAQLDDEEEYDMSSRALDRFIYITGWNEINYVSPEKRSIIMCSLIECLQI